MPHHQLRKGMKPARSSLFASSRSLYFFLKNSRAGDIAPCIRVDNPTDGTVDNKTPDDEVD